MHQQTLELLPVGNVEARVVEGGVSAVVWVQGYQGIEVRVELSVGGEHRFPVHPEHATALASLGLEHTSVQWIELPLQIGNGGFVLAGLNRHETNTVQSAIGRVAEDVRDSGPPRLLGETPL